MTRRSARPEDQIQRAVLWRLIPGWPAYSVSSDGCIRGPRKTLRQFPNRKGYLVVQLCNGGVCRTQFVARLVAAAFLPDFTGDCQVDHIDGRKTHNSVTNLRVATNSQNAKNRARYCNSSTGFKGVSFRKRERLFCARIQVNGRRIGLGLFPTAELASSAYLAAAASHYGPFAREGVNATT